MKHFALFFLVIFCFLFSQCSRMRSVSMNSMQPAEITFPSYVQSLLLLDRTKFDKQTGNIEGLLTGELPGEDKAGLQEAMNSFQQTLRSSPRFELKRASETLTGNSLTAAFPEPLSWNKIDELCKKYKTDAVIAIEIFDTDFIITDGKRKVKKQIEEKGVKKEIEVDEFFAKGIGDVKIGFRLYDPKAKSIADQQLFSRTNTWEATGTTIADALMHLVAKADATRHLGGQVGLGYAYKIAPMPVTIGREYYGKGKRMQQVAAGSRQAEVNDWRGAISTWENAVDYAPPKDAGRLCYNIAVGYEVLGEMGLAKQWANRAYVGYRNKKARGYAYALDYRIASDERVEQQMK